jgi:hypothetical protein
MPEDRQNYFDRARALAKLNKSQLFRSFSRDAIVGRRGNLRRRAQFFWRACAVHGKKMATHKHRASRLTGGAMGCVFRAVAGRIQFKFSQY